jgi:nucleoside-diphosphate-sugar epimerase
MKILVAGGAGYLGSRLVPALLEHGYDVDVIDLLWFGNYLPTSVKLIQNDVFKLVESDLEQYDQVIFVAGVSSVPTAEILPAKNFIFNAAAPSYLAYCAKRAGVKRFIYASTCSVYEAPLNESCRETFSPSCSHPYAMSKLLGEQGVLHLQDEIFSVIAFRMGTVCGYSPRMRLDLIVNAMVKSALKDKAITVVNPEVWRPILSISDATQAYIKATEADLAISGAFNIASENYTVGKVGKIVADILQVNVKTKSGPDLRNYKISTAKAKAILSFHPQQKVEQIVEELVANVESFSDWDSPKYYNIKMLEGLSL